MISPPHLELRRAANADGPPALELVSAVLAEYGLHPDPDGTDADLGDIEAHYHGRGGDFVVLVGKSGELVGTCGLFPLSAEVIELRKMYLAPSVRGFGEGRRLLDWALTRARELRFRRMMLETASVLKVAIGLYEKHGFRRDEQGCHSGRCDLVFTREL